MAKKAIIRVQDVMKQDFDKVDGLDTVETALKKMQFQDSHILIVNKRNDDDEYGIVLLSDIAKKVIAKDRSPERVNIYEIMAKPAICIRSDMDIRYCARLFSRFGISVAPVVDSGSGELAGVVSYNDIVLNGLVKL